MCARACVCEKKLKKENISKVKEFIMTSIINSSRCFQLFFILSDLFPFLLTYIYVYMYIVSK